MGHFENGKCLEEGSIVEVLSIDGDIATVKDAKTGSIFHINAWYEKKI